jgi:TolB-like protein
MGENEQTAFDLLRRNRAIQKPLINQFGGTWLKEMGDGILASFDTASDAVYCAKVIQEVCETEPQLSLRIGIHLGEVVFEDGDVFGDGVNIASRLEPLAPAGGILISEAVQRNILNKTDLETAFFRKLHLKNVRHPINSYQVRVGDAAFVDGSAMTGRTEGSVFKILGVILLVVVAAILAYRILPIGNAVKQSEKTSLALEKSIAVLPLVNMSSDPDQEYFSDGITEEILNQLVKVGELKVTSRTSVMQYKGTDKSIKDIAKDLGVAHVLEGSVRKDRDNIRITVQLIDALSDRHLWSETYDREFTDIFAIQSEVAQQVARALNAQLQPAVIQSMDVVPTENMEAYELYLKALANFQNINPENMSLQIDWLRQAIMLDSTFSTGYALLGNSIIFKAGFAGETSAKEIAMEAKQALEKALYLNPLDAIAHAMMGAYLLWFERDFKRAEIEQLTAQKLAPSDARSPAFAIDLYMATGQFSKAVQTGEKLLNIDDIPINWARNALARSFAGDLAGMEQAIKAAKLADRSNMLAFTEIARAYLIQGQYEKIPPVLDQSPDASTIPRGMALLSIAHTRIGNYELGDQWFDALTQRGTLNSGGSPSFYLAMIHASRGENEKAFRWLEKSIVDNEIELYWLKVEPEFSSLHDDPRWAEMLDRIGFPG